MIEFITSLHASLMISTAILFLIKDMAFWRYERREHKQAIELSCAQMLLDKKLVEMRLASALAKSVQDEIDREVLDAIRNVLVHEK